MSGLDNYGSTCYVNSVVQVLRYCKPVVTPLVETTPSSQMLRTFLDLLYQDSKVQPFLRHLREAGFEPSMQHDTHEFFITMLDKLYEDVDEKNPFEGKLISTCVCPNGHKSVTSHPFVSLSINGSVTKGVEEFMAPENVQCSCDKCDAKEMVRTIDFEPGEAICFHLKRFSIDKKLSYKIPIEKKWMNYSLVGMCNHVGSLHGGHYSALVKSDNGWLFANDEIIRNVDGPPKESPLPYLLVYVSDK